MSDTDGWTLKQCQQEIWLSGKLGISLSGVTDLPARREMVRGAILERKLADTEAVRTRSTGIHSWRQLFQRCYGEPLVEQKSWL